jgi:thiol-disulfide isomerase/thioredoxin
MLSSRLFSLAALMMGIGFLAGPALAQEEDTTSLEGKKAPDISLATLDGKHLKLSELKGKVVVVEFWASWCPTCRKSLPHLNALSQDKQRADKGLVALAVNAREEAKVVQKYLKENSYTFTVPMDRDGAAMKAYLIGAIPTALVIGSDGMIRSVFIGFVGQESERKLDEAVDKALSEKSAV